MAAAAALAPLAMEEPLDAEGPAASGAGAGAGTGAVNNSSG